MAELPLYTVDAFTSEPFAGNPAAVCLLNKVNLKKNSVFTSAMVKV